MIASVMLMRPRVLLADEPTTALDLSTQGEVLKTLVAMRSEQQMSIILITHDLDLAASICDRVSVMYAGSVVEMQPSKALYQGPRHPYSQGLFLSRPRLDTRSTTLPTMPGRPTTLVELAPDSCTFAPRCWAADEDCTSEFPALVPVPDGLVRCVHAETVRDQSRSVVANEPSVDRAPASSQLDPVMLSVRDLSKSFGTRRRHETRAVESVSFTVPNQGSLAIIGESGSGKTTTARMILGLERPTSGEILVAGEDWSAPASGRAERKRRARTAQMVFQDPLGSLDPSQTVGDALTEARREHFEESAEQRDRHIRDLADRVGLSTKQLDSRPMNLSGGQRQRAAIARALVIGSPLLVLDEPASALDVSIQATIINLLNELRRSMGLTYLLISHDIGVVAQLAERAVVMQSGEIVEEGPLDLILTRPSHPYTETLMASLPQPPW
jgi:peptide/nickel transport system ATP-binding protein